MRAKISTVLLIAIAILTITGINTVFASENGSGAPFTVTPVLPFNQDETIKSYISITPDKSSVNQALKFVIENNQDKKQKIDVKAVNAYTSPNGVVAYVRDKNKNRNSEIINKSYQMADYLTSRSGHTLILEPKSKQVITMDLKADKIDGTLLGGVSFQMMIDDDSSKSSQASTMKIKNKLNQVIGVVVNNTTDKEADFSFGDVFVDPMPSYYVVRLPIIQPSPVLLSGATIEYNVTYNGTELFDSVKNIDFAPMTKTNFAIPYESEEIKKNEPYILKGTLTYTDQNNKEQKVDFEKTFEFDGKSHNNTGETFKTPSINGFPYWLLLFLLLIPAIIYYWIKRNRRYVVYSDSDPVLKIEADTAFANAVQLKKNAYPNKESAHVHYYVKKKVKDATNKNYTTHYFKYRKTKNNKVKPSN